MDSLDWMWEDCNNTLNPAVAIEKFDDDDYVFYEHDNDGGSDISSDSNVSCTLLTGDKETVQKLNDIVSDIKKQFDNGDVEDDNHSDSLSVNDFEDDEHHAHVDKFYIDALEAVKNKLSEVQLVWTDTLYKCTVNEKNVPDSYIKITNIEKLVLLYAKNFIEQFKVKYPNRRQLILVHENECGIQKCICTTIKPSRLVYHDLNDLTSYSTFVAKHITYTQLEDPIIVPKKIVSPTTTLEMQTANCFELATLLVSFLIGCGYNAFVVQGYATENVCNNDLRKIKLDLPKNNFKEIYNPESENIDELDDDYNLEPMNDLCSEYVQYLLEKEKSKNVQNEVKENDLISSFDPLNGKRVHSWVMVMPLEIDVENINKNSYFIEPSTGERKDISYENYIGIESIWNHKNYWVNLQTLDGGCTQYDFNLMNTKYWEHFLPDEPQNLRGVTLNLQNNKNEIPRHIVMPNSWVNILEVPRNKYYMLYPNGVKIIPYMNGLIELYADYIMPDGLIERTTYYAEPNFVNKIFIKKIYKNRLDKLISVEISYTDKGIETVEYFKSGRKDCLKMHKFCGDINNIETDRLITFYNLRYDSMVELQIDKNNFVAMFEDRSDFLFWRMCEFHQPEESTIQTLNSKRKITNIVEKYLRDESKHKDRDIATRSFNLISNYIYVQYQYGEGQITQSSRLFHKPPITSIDEFDPELVIENIVYPYEGHLKPYEAYFLLQDMIKDENKALGDISKLEDDVLKMLEVRSREESEFKLKIDSLDWDRNHKIRKLLQIEKDKKLAIAKRDKTKEIEYALPYFETIERPFTYETALKIRDKVIKDFKQNIYHQFMRTKKLFMKKNITMQSMLKALETYEFEDQQKNKMKMSCVTLKNELDVLMLKMERYKDTRVKRYNILASYLNTNVDFKMLSPLKLLDLN